MKGPACSSIYRRYHNALSGWLRGIVKLSGIDIELNINNIKAQIEANNILSTLMRIAMNLLLLIITLLCQ